MSSQSAAAASSRERNEREFARRCTSSIVGSLRACSLSPPSQSSSTLTDLFTHLSTRIEPSVLGTIYGQDTSNHPFPAPHYYELLSRHLEVDAPLEAERIHDSLVPLWSSPMATTVYSLLLHRWLFSTNGPSGAEKYVAVCLKGVLEECIYIF
jgi:hypothetical protein